MTKVAAVLYSYYPQDTRPHRESEALIEAGMQVDMICLKGDGQKIEENVNGVNVYRLPMGKNRTGKCGYIIEYSKFILLSFFKLSRLHLRNKYDIIHIHNMPDILVLVALLPKIFGSKVLLDLHDPMPELFMTKYSVVETSIIVKILKVAEKFSIKFADVIITPNISFRELFISRGCPEGKIFIVMNSPMEKIISQSCFAGDPRGKDPDKFVVMFHGGIFERHGIDTVVEAIANLKDKIPGIELKVFGNGDYVHELLRLIEIRGVQNIVKYHKTVPVERIFREIKTTDVGVIPNKKSPFTDLNMPVRIFEYLSLGKAVIAPRTKGIQDYFDDNSLLFFEPGDHLSLENAILNVYQNKNKVDEIVKKGMNIHYNHRWELQKKMLVDQVTYLSQ